MQLDSVGYEGHYMGSSLNWGPFWDPFYKGAVVWWGPELQREFRLWVPGKRPDMWRAFQDVTKTMARG